MRTFAACCRFPISFGDGVPTASVGDPDGRIILLGAEYFERETIIGRNAVKLGCGLIVVSSPIEAAVHRHLGTSIIGNDHALIVLGVNPKIMVITVGRIETLPSFTSIIRTMITCIHDI